MDSYLLPLLGFCLVVVLIPVSLLLLKRTPLGAAFSDGAPEALMRTMAKLQLSATQRLIAVEVGHGAGRRWLVLGGTPQNIAVLHTMEPQGEAAADETEPSVSPPAAQDVPNAPFEEFLEKLRHFKGGGNVH